MSTTTHSPDRPSARPLLVVTGLLLLLLAAAVGVHFLPTGWWRPVLALTIAGAKAVLILLFFMRARHARGTLPLVIGGAYLWLAILFTLTFADYLSR